MNAHLRLELDRSSTATSANIETLPNQYRQILRSALPETPLRHKQEGNDKLLPDMN